MVIAFLAAAAATPSVHEPARASVVIQRAVRVSEREWKADQARRQRELVRVEDGRRVRLRLTEFE